MQFWYGMACGAALTALAAVAAVLRYRLLTIIEREDLRQVRAGILEERRKLRAARDEHEGKSAELSKTIDEWQEEIKRVKAGE